ncbi:unnamed protein product, partial [Staurois parvus]
FSTTSGNPELHSGLPCGVAQGVPAALTLSFAPAMCPLQHPRPSPPVDAGIRLPCSVPVMSGRTGTGGKFEIFKKFHFFKNDFVPSALSWPCLHFYCSY